MDSKSVNWVRPNVYQRDMPQEWTAIIKTQLAKKGTGFAVCHFWYDPKPSSAWKPERLQKENQAAALWFYTNKIDTESEVIEVLLKSQWFGTFALQNGSFYPLD